MQTMSCCLNLCNHCCCTQGYNTNESQQIWCEYWQSEKFGSFSCWTRTWDKLCIDNSLKCITSFSIYLQQPSPEGKEMKWCVVNGPYDVYTRPTMISEMTQAFFRKMEGNKTPKPLTWKLYSNATHLLTKSKTQCQDCSSTYAWFSWWYRGNPLQALI